MSAGDPVLGVTCPLCGNETVVYNGNYFCDDVGAMSGEGCEWVMPEGYESPAIIRAYLTQRLDQALAAGDVPEAEEMRLYLAEEGLCQ